MSRASAHKTIGRMNRKRRILFVFHWPPPVHGSSIMGLQIKENRMIASSFDCQYINLGTSETIEEIGENILGKIMRYGKILSAVCRRLIGDRPDICYLAITAKGIGFYKDAVVAVLAKLCRVKLVLHFHNKGVRERQH